MPDVRHSHVVYVLIRLPLSTGPTLLFRRHEKWGDWSLVGGHVEDEELDDWQASAARETMEELEPLEATRDFVVQPMHAEPLIWGPEASRSARGRPTIYHVRYFFLEFQRSPVELLNRLPASTVLCVPESELQSTPHALGNPVLRASHCIPGGMAAVPFAWSRSIDRRALPTTLFHLADGTPPSMGT